jgi:hypothetical protein
MATEHSLWQWLRKARDTFGTALRLARLENLAGAGAPDVEGCLRGAQLWLELKVAARPARKATRLRFGSPLRDSQVEWAKEQLSAGGPLGYLIQVGAGPERAIYLIHGCKYEALHAGVNEEWCIANNELDRTTPDRVVQLATMLTKEHFV